MRKKHSKPTTRFFNLSLKTEDPRLKTHQFDKPVLRVKLKFQRDVAEIESH